MKTLSRWLAVLGLLALLAACVVGLYYGITFVVACFRQVDPGVGILVMSACCVAVFCTVVLTRAVRQAQGPDTGVIWLRKSEVYGRACQACVFTFATQPSRPRRQVVKQEMDFSETEMQLFLLGSPGVIQAYTACQEQSRSSIAEWQAAFLHLLQEMREDLGEGRFEVPLEKLLHTISAKKAEDLT